MHVRIVFSLQEDKERHQDVRVGEDMYGIPFKMVRFEIVRNRGSNCYSATPTKCKSSLHNNIFSSLLLISLKCLLLHNSFHNYIFSSFASTTSCMLNIIAIELYLYLVCIQRNVNNKRIFYFVCKE